jgi:hypothetical protein
MNRRVVGIFYRFHCMEDIHVARTLMSFAHDLAHRDHRSRAGPACAASGTPARCGRLSCLWLLESARASPLLSDPLGPTMGILASAAHRACPSLLLRCPGLPPPDFFEPFPVVLAPYARQTERLRQIVLELAHASSAEMAARVAHGLGYRTSPDTLMRRQRAEPFIFPPPRVLGVDEFALRRGHIYATLVVDLDRHHPVAVLEGRTAAPLTKWLQSHPQVTMVAGDRADAYAVAGRLAVPDARQVADRFHLVRNIGDALNALVHSRPWQQSTTAEKPETAPLDAPTTGPASSDIRPKEPQPSPRKRAFWEAVQQRKYLGQSVRHIPRALGLDR